ncbi:hypothetical protein CH35J_011829 [Colletotrichum higginsianum]|uniref:BZIP domain-containing protein n=1 Tax=Colletotrichum higginsianum TaxID=80884 RepID=A0A4T0VEI4_9PEZI|nr:hypothetical protein CH35J_011829 [Colletotrichum higginsianum]
MTKGRVSQRRARHFSLPSNGLSHWAHDSSTLPDEAGLLDDLQYHHHHQQQQQQHHQLQSSAAAGLPGADFGLFGPESVLDPTLAFLDPLDPSPWDTLSWTSPASATPHLGASPLDNSLGQPFPFIDTSPPTLFDTFPDPFPDTTTNLFPPQLDPSFASSSSSGSNPNSNSNSPNQPPPLDMAAAYAAVSSGAPPPLLPSRASPNTSDGRDSDVATPHADKILRRQRNTIAARKYRQKKVDRIDELEAMLKEMTRERDDLRIRLARQEAETEALKSIMRADAKK